jgi:flavin reductase (DIM6/NTAB) family NADH-FMN oxidoreductase RutF
MGQFATGVTVIATGLGDAMHVMTANAITSVSLDPLLILISLGKNTKMADKIAENGSFGVSILAQDQEPLSRYFSGGWKEADPPPFRFEILAGIPRLEGCTAAIACEVDTRHDVGDHWIILGKVIGLHYSDDPVVPLVFHAGQYRKLEEA